MRTVTSVGAKRAHCVLHACHRHFRRRHHRHHRHPHRHHHCRHAWPTVCWFRSEDGARRSRNRCAATTLSSLLSLREEHPAIGLETSAFPTHVHLRRRIDRQLPHHGKSPNPYVAQLMMSHSTTMRLKTMAAVAKTATVVTTMMTTTGRVARTARMARMARTARTASSSAQVETASRLHQRRGKEVVRTCVSP